MKSSKSGGALGNHRRYVSGSKHCTHVRYMFNNLPSFKLDSDSLSITMYIKVRTIANAKYFFVFRSPLRRRLGARTCENIFGKSCSDEDF